MKILVIEDEKKVALALQKGLESEHYDVQVALTGEEGFYLLCSWEFDLVVLDLILPGRRYSSAMDRRVNSAPRTGIQFARKKQILIFKKFPLINFMIFIIRSIQESVFYQRKQSVNPVLSGYLFSLTTIISFPRVGSLTSDVSPVTLMPMEFSGGTERP